MMPLTRPWIDEADIEAVTDVLRSGWLTQGSRVGRFEEAFRHRVGATDAVAVSSCTTALQQALHVVGVGPGDDVLVPSFSFIATTAVVAHTGARPVFADVDLVTGNVSVDTLEAAVTPSTRAVIAVHQAGVPLDLPALNTWCEARNLPLIEDAACALGATCDGSPVGADAYMAAFSFHPRKVLTTGEGGMLATRDPALGQRLRRLRDHGSNLSAATRERAPGAGSAVVEQYLEMGFNHRMTDLQGALGEAQLTRLADMIARRRARAGRYHDLLRHLPGVHPVRDPAWGTGTFQSFWIRLEGVSRHDRDHVMEHLARRDISSRRGIMATHREPACAALATGWSAPAGLDVTELLSDTSLILPLWHHMTDDDQDRVVHALAEVWS
jgi:perosamine synthetase